MSDAKPDQEITGGGAAQLALQSQLSTKEIRAPIGADRTSTPAADVQVRIEFLIQLLLLGI